MKKKLTLLYALLLALSLILSGCQGDAGPAGTPGADGTSGSSGTTGPQGPVGQTGSTGTLPSDPFAVANFHGAANTVEATRGPNNAANPVTEITGASINSDGKLVIDFKVTQSGAAFTTLASSAITFRFAQLRNGESAGDSTYWVNYVNTKARKKAGYGFSNNTGLEMNQPSGEAGSTTGGTWDDSNKATGTYRYTTKAKLTDGITISYPPKAGTYAYDATLPHRVATQMGDPDGTGSATMGANNAVYDFIPANQGNTDGGKVVDPREIVVVENCNTACHKTLGLHGGGRLDTKLCVVCHNPTNGDPESGNILDFKVMVHKIHSGKYLPSVNIDFAGEFNGLYNTNPDGAIKGTPYTIWGHNNAKHDYSEVLFPANPANCLMCHKNATKADNYKSVPTKEACGSCHDGIKWSTDFTGTRMWFLDSKISMGVQRTDFTGFAAEITKGHLPGVKTNAECATCHTSSGSQASADASPAPIPATHGDFTDVWSKIDTDYTIDMTMSAPANGTHYVATEKPIVTIVLKNATTGLPIDHTTISDASTSDFGAGACSELYGLNTVTSTTSACSGKKGVVVNGALNLYVSGPRALRKPALTTAAANKGFFSLTNNIYGSASNDLRTRTGTNAALMDNYSSAPGKLTGVISRVDAGQIQYRLKDVSGLTAGTYVAMVHATKKSSAGIVPNAMSLALTRFQVGQAAEEKRIAFGCADCHSTNMWHDNAVNGVPGNHPAAFGDPDYCGNCHDYEAQAVPFATGAGTTYKVSLDSSGNEVFTSLKFPAGSGQVWKAGGNNMGFSAAPIARRVHGVHFAKKANGTLGVNYPFEIYNGHNVSIVWPQDIKNCEKCHPAATTSGTWKTKAGRVACLACHDSDATYAHAVLNTFDPTPTIATASAATTTPSSGPYTGDEIESCPVCHTPK